MANEFKIKNGLIVSGSADIEQDLRVRGTLTVDELHASITTSSIIYESGSTRFGDTIDDTHTFTGSVNISGSISLNGQAIGTGKLDEITFNSFTASYITDSGSFETRIGDLESFSSSLDTSFVSETEFGNYSGSINTFTSSIDGRVDNLETLSGSFTGSFTGSFIGDGTNLFNIPASGVTGLNLSQISTGSISASLSLDGFNINTDTSITGTLIASGLRYPTVDNGEKSFIQTDGNGNLSLQYVDTLLEPIRNGEATTLLKGTPVYVSGSLGANPIVYAADAGNPTKMPVIYIVNENILTNEVGEGIVLGKIEGVNTTGYAPGTEIFVGVGGGWTSTRPTGSAIIQSLGIVTKEGTGGQGIVLNPGPANLPNLPTNELFIGDTNSHPISKTIVEIGLATTSSLTSLSSSIATTDLNQTNRLISLEGVSGSYATTGSNLFKGTQTHSGSILPSVDNTYDLGSADYQWRDVYISSGSLYIDGTKVLSSTAQELTITTDSGQSIKILESGTDSIILQTADGDIELKSNADGDILLDPTNGKIMLKGPVEIFNGNKIQSSVNGTPVVFASDIVVSGSIDITGTIEGIDLTSFSSSVNTRLGNLETSTGSLNAFTSSTNSRLSSIETVTSSFVTYSGTTNNRLTSIESSTSSLNSFTSSANSRLNSIESSTGSLNNYTGSNNTIIGTLQTATGSLNSYTSSNTTNINAIHTATSSLNSFTSSINTTIKNRLNTEGVISGSSQVILTGTTGYSTFSSSIATSVNDLSSSINSLTSTDESHNTRLTTIEGRYATTGSNVFKGDQTITGSLYISQNLIVQGSSSLENITASAVSIGTNTIILNADTPAIRYAGISVFDSGSTNVTASLFYDSLTNNWKFQHSDVGTDDASILLYGPLGTGIDNAPTLVGNFLTKVEDNGHGHHLTTSSIFDNGSKISLKNNTEITGSVIITSTIVSQGTTLVSGSGQISYVGITNVPSGIVSGSSQVISLLPAGTVSGSSQVLNGSGVWSGSAQLPSGIVSGSGQVSFNGITDKPTLVSGSSQVSFNGITDKPTLVSGSSQITFSGLSGIPSGIVSGSSQVLNGTTIHSGSFFNGITVVSGSAQISFNGITDKPTLVSGSSQITFGSISSIPGGLVSGSSQIDLTATTNYSTGIKTRLNAEGVISGSVQVIAALPNGTVSGSSQITISSTTGYGSILNQAVLTTSTPTFSKVTLTGSGDSLLLSNSSTAETYAHINNTGVASNYVYLRLTSATGDGYLIKNNTTANSVGDSSLYIWNSNSMIEFVPSGLTANRTTIATSGNMTVRGNISASNFSGTSSGTNTGDQTNISGNAGTVTNGVYTTGNQTIGGTKTFSATTIINVAGFAGMEYYNATAQWQGYIGTENNTGNLRYNSFNGTHTFYANGTQTMSVNSSGQLSLSGSNSSSAPLVNLTATGTGTFQRGVRLLNSGMNAGDHIMMAVGQADGARNMGQFYFQYNGAGSTSNRLSLGLHSVDDVFNIWGNGNVEIGSTFNSGYKLDVAGQLRAYAGTPLIVSMSTVASNDAVIAARWTSGTGLEMRYNPNNALCYIDSTYPLSSGQVFGDIHIRQNVGGTMTSRMTFKAETGHILPGANGTQNLGASSLRWSTVFTSDLSLSNGIGDYTIVEGENDLFLYNNKQNKVYKFMLQEVNAEDATPKRPE